MTVIKVFLFVVALMITLVFAYYNMEDVKLKFLNYSLEMPLFLALLVSLSVGFLLAYLVSEIRIFSLRRYRDRVRKALRNLWTGYPRKAENALKGLASSEEMVPLYLMSLKDQNKHPEINTENYRTGIAETFLAETFLRQDLKRAKDLLEKALGKNWDNLRAKRLLRSIYFLEGEHQKAVDLQRSLISAVESGLREEEEKVLASMISESLGEKALDEVERLPKTLSSLALIISRSEEDKGAKIFQKALDQGMGSDLLAVLWERRSLTPRILEITWERREDFDPDLLVLLYADMGMVERLEGLKERISPPIRFFTERDWEVCKELLKVVDIWACGECGMEYRSYTPVCVGCLAWNRLKIKGGRSYDHRLLQGDSEV